MRKDRGFTLVELLISSGLFIVLVGLAAGVFIQTLRTQRIIINLSASMNDAAFVIEGMAREIRTGSSFNDTTGEVEVLQFTNDNDYEIMTSPEVGLDRLNFILMGTEAGDNFPPRVSIILTVIGEKGITINLQTTVSARILDT